MSFLKSAWRGLYAWMQLPARTPDVLDDTGMEVTGDDSVGWSARYPGDPNWVWSGSSRETVIRGCRQRRDEVNAGTLKRGPTGFYSP